MSWGGVCPTCGWWACRCNHWTPSNDLSWWKVQYLACEHCYCKQPTAHNGEGEHRQCCKCGTVMAVQFLPQAS